MPHRFGQKMLFQRGGVVAKRGKGGTKGGTKGGRAEGMRAKEELTSLCVDLG